MEAERIALLHLNPNDVLAVFNGRLKMQIQDLPPDVKVISVNAEWPPRSIVLMLESEEFEPVPLGAIPPAIYRPISLTLAGWQPIETAPKDGTTVLVELAGDPPTTAYFSEEWGWLLATPGGGATDRRCNPTHWMPLPESPKEVLS